MIATDTAPETTAEERVAARVLWPLLGLFWLGSIAATLAQVYASVRLNGVQPTLLDLLRWVLPGYLVWLVSVPLIVFVLARRFRFEEGRWRRSVPIHMLACLCIAGGVLAVDALFVLMRHPEREFAQVVVNLARGWLLWLVFTYWFFLTFLSAIRHYTTAAARRLRESRLEAALANAQLAALRTQLHPHFLFNALNSISSLIDEDRTAARRMIAQLGELLRASLTDGAGEWTVRQELEVLDRYTAIERIRFGERLQFDVRCVPEALDTRLPALLLQPLVENAILHGIQPAVSGGVVQVSARGENGWLEVEVSDNGVGVSEDVHERVGLKNTRQRLERCYPGQQTLKIMRRDPTGTRVLIRIPWSTSTTRESLHVAPR